MSQRRFEISSYQAFFPEQLPAKLLGEAVAVAGMPRLTQVGEGTPFEDPKALALMVELYDRVKDSLRDLLRQRQLDRRFLDERTQALATYHREWGIAPTDPDYQTTIGIEDSDGRVVFGPLSPQFCQGGGAAVASLPEHLRGPHVTLFGPPDSAKLAINAMNAYHRRLPDEPTVVAELVASAAASVKWGADCEDSKTPLRQDLGEAGLNLAACYDGTLTARDPATGRTYTLASSDRAVPIKRFPGLALPCSFLFVDDQPVPLHLYDFALHIYRNRRHPSALSFYVPKLENEAEARYVHQLVATAEELLGRLEPEYAPGTIRLLIVLENARAVFRIHEIMDALHPYFAGASLGWHDFLASTARLFKHDPHYRIPIKADPHIVINHIAESHRLLAEVVGSRGGIKVGGMYGVLPVGAGRGEPSFQIALKGFFKDAITQLRRGLNGFWLAHPDFVRIALAVVESWRRRPADHGSSLDRLLSALLREPHLSEVRAFAQGKEAPGLDRADPAYPRALLAANVLPSTQRANNDPEEVRYNVFQSLQYLADWLAGRGCVALPTTVEGEAVRVMDDLATAERSRWEVWHEVYHGRFSLGDLLRITAEELDFIRKDRRDGAKAVQVKWDERTAKWYPVAQRIMLLLMTNSEPAEFATELLLPFTLPVLRDRAEPLQAALELMPDTYRLRPEMARLHRYFEACGCQRFAEAMAALPLMDVSQAAATVSSLSIAEINEAARFHGDIGGARSTLDAHGAKEQAQVLAADAAIQEELRAKGQSYSERFGFKFLVAARGKSATELLKTLTTRLARAPELEAAAAREALWQIARQRLEGSGGPHAMSSLAEMRQRHGIIGAQVALTGGGPVQSLAFGHLSRGGAAVTPQSRFELASLSKTIATAFALDCLDRYDIALDTPVNDLLQRLGSPLWVKAAGRREWEQELTVRDLMAHTALNLHYVPGAAADLPAPPVLSLLLDPTAHGYEPVRIIHEPGSRFAYSGGGFLVLEHLIETLTGATVKTLLPPYLSALGINQISFDLDDLRPGSDAEGHLDSGQAIPGGRLKFPAFAAGAVGSAGDLLAFLQALGRAAHHLDGAGPISHDAAVAMLHGSDRGARAFMGTDMGLGVFVAEAGDNRFAIHQGANDGFRALYLSCFAGPDRGKGFVILANGDDGAVAFIAEAAGLLLRELAMGGIDYGRLRHGVSAEGLKKEEIVNRNYQKLIFAAFAPTLPEAPEERGPPDPLAAFNVATRARVLRPSNQRFARATNLLSDRLPTFDPRLYGRQGKIMDSWETARHNPAAFDSVEIELSAPNSLRYVAFSTQFHDGNHGEAVRLYGRLGAGDPWQELLPLTALAGHSLLRIALAEPSHQCRHIRVDLFPDGGLSRLGLYAELPAANVGDFLPVSEARCQRFAEPLPAPRRPLTLPYAVDQATIQRHRRRLGQEVGNHASRALGGQVLAASNEHYGPALQVISPLPPLHMFDGLESRRSREPDHFEECLIQLGGWTWIERVVLDFTHFVNNNPVAVALEAELGEQRTSLVGRTPVKAYAGNRRALTLRTPVLAERVRLRLYPDGGLNRLEIYGRAAAHREGAAADPGADRDAPLNSIAKPELLTKGKIPWVD